MAIYPQLHETYTQFYEQLLRNLSDTDREEVARLSEILYHNALALVKEGKA